MKLKQVLIYTKPQLLCMYNIIRLWKNMQILTNFIMYRIRITEQL